MQISFFETLLFIVPFVSGLIFIFSPIRSKKPVSFIGIFLITLVFLSQIAAFIMRPELGNYFAIDNLNGFILIFFGFFTLLTAIYSSAYFESQYHKFLSLLLMTLGVSNFTVLTNNLFLLLMGWGFLGITLYLLINFLSPESASSAKKTFIMVGASDAFLLLGIAILWNLTGSFNIDKISSSIGGVSNNLYVNLALITFIIAAFTKAGAFPCHTWIPEISTTTSLPTLAYLPASIDKLLGIYLLSRAVMDIFKVSPVHWVGPVLVLLGAFTVIAAVMMALVQHNVRKLLAYHAVSQVGYMVMGIGTLHPIGIIGGLFHMLNHAIYKSCLFLSAGNVEKRTKTLELSELGGLATFMPLTFLAMLIASFSISGVPPFNGFYSKWMVYQATIISFTNSEHSFSLRFLYVVSLVLAMIGSGLTLASFLKVIFGIFLGQKSKIAKNIKEVSKAMLIPVLALSLFCVLFGIFAKTFVLRYLINPLPINSLYGAWSPGIATVLLIAGIVLGVMIFLFSKVKVRFGSTFIGGEDISDDFRPRATELYNQVMDMPILTKVYKLAEKKIFDIYEMCLKFVFIVIKLLRYLHNGILPTYLVWCLIGILVLIFKIVK